LELELTESLTLDDSEATLDIMRGLKALGVSLSLDDFGTGWSSLSYLRSFPIDRLKIDRTFMRDVATHPDAAAVVHSILNLAQSLGLGCVAEGVETAEQLDYLENQLCAELQGFLFSKALPPEELPALLLAKCHPELLRAGSKPERPSPRSFRPGTGSSAPTSPVPPGDRDRRHPWRKGHDLRPTNTP
jgi:EAL domain-containing protein (putative c-di-GMP-specific phosphodiesterase class I)